jgi:hypothetical protein
VCLGSGLTVNVFFLMHARLYSCIYCLVLHCKGTTDLDSSFYYIKLPLISHVFTVNLLVRCLMFE